MERDQPRERHPRSHDYFNSRAHVERDFVIARRTGVGRGFQLTRSRGARLSVRQFPRLTTNFNSRAHVERDQEISDAYKTALDISTHALTWSATAFIRSAFIRAAISTHALTWSATGISNLADRGISISTHALTWSATCATRPPSPRCEISTHALTWSAT